jgi:hypothetical protein
MFGEHVGHKMEKLAIIYERNVELIKTEANGLKKRLEELNTY